MYFSFVAESYERAQLKHLFLERPYDLITFQGDKGKLGESSARARALTQGAQPAHWDCTAQISFPHYSPI